ncbi:MAG TPA: hypothetical protein VK894_00495 [Jiangellales bacterium]|nr:hypothetical protein [Jiangellales bacterium]
MTTEETFPRPPGGATSPGTAGTTPPTTPRAATAPAAGTGMGGTPVSTPPPPGDNGKSATEEGKQRAGQVAGTAKDEAAHVVEEGKRQASDLLHQFRGQVDDQVLTQRDRLGETLRGVGGNLTSMSRGEPAEGPAQQIVEELGQRSQQLADWISRRDGTELVEELRSFARRKPGTFLLGSLALGVLAGRLTRGAKAAASESGDDGRDPARAYPVSGTPAAYGTTSGYGAPAPYGTGTGTAVGTGSDPLAAGASPTGTSPRPALADDTLVDDPLDPARTGQGAYRRE